MASRQQQIRRIIVTASIVAITATGTWYGAGLKTQQEINQARAVPCRTDARLWSALMAVDLTGAEKARRGALHG